MLESKHAMPTLVTSNFAKAVEVPSLMMLKLSIKESAYPEDLQLIPRHQTFSWFLDTNSIKVFAVKYTIRNIHYV